MNIYNNNKKKASPFSFIPPFHRLVLLFVAVLPFFFVGIDEYEF